MVRLVRVMWFGSWPSAVLLATLAAAAAMVMTAAVSVLASDRVAAAADLYGPRLARSGKRCVRAVPAPDTCVVQRTLTFDRPVIRPSEALWQLMPLNRARPLHEAVEVPEDFI